MFVKKNILGVGVTNARQIDILEYISENIEKPRFRSFIVTPNPEIITYAQKHPSFKEILNKADFALCDGIGIVLAGHLLGVSFKERITGVDFMKNLCEKVAEKPVKIGFLGGKERVAEETAECLRKISPSLKVVYASEEFDVKTFPKTGVDILFIAFGFPKQEEWVSKYFDILPVKVAMGVGGAFDYLSGRVPRAPFLIRSVGLEWLYRLIREPWRFRRQLELITFIRLVLKARLNKRK